MAKKASLELSINAIVIVVLAFVLLGLGLGFIRNQFKSIGETTGQVQEQVKAQILEDLRTGDKKLSFPSARVQLDKGGARDLAVGVKNTEPSGSLTFYIDVFTSQEKTEGDAEDIRCIVDNTVTSFSDLHDSIECEGGDNSNGIDKLDYFWDPGPYTLSVAAAEVYPIAVEDTAKESKSYLVKIRIMSVVNIDDDPDTIDPIPYAEKSFFVQVT